MPGVNPSNRRLRRANNLTEYGVASGGFGFGIPARIGTSYHGFRLFNRIKKECCKTIPPPAISWKIFDTLTITTTDDTEFGKFIAMSEDGTFLAVIAQDVLYPNPPFPANNQRKGKVYIYKLNGGAYVEVSTHTPTANNMRIGNSGNMAQIAISDDGHTVVYQEHDINTNTGSAIILKKNANNDQFTQIHKLLVDNNAGSAEVAISGDASRVAVAAPSEKEIDIYLLNAGNGQYAQEGGTIENNNNNNAANSFGRSLSFNTDGSRLVVGTNNGFYILGRTGAGGAWASVQEILGNAGQTGSFGKDVSISGNGECLVASLPNDGNINVYKKDANANTFTLDTTINTNYGGMTDQFGHSLNISKDGSKIITGNPGYDTPNNNNGMIVVYKKDGNNYVVDHEIITGNAGDGFGYDNAISNNGMMIVGSAPDFPDNNDHGYVRVYKLH